jgi:hypothetical protein
MKYHDLILEKMKKILSFFYQYDFKDEEHFIVEKHNELRRKVAKGLETRGANGSGPQPKAADMFQMCWDPLLAKMSQRLEHE